LLRLKSHWLSKNLSASRQMSLLLALKRFLLFCLDEKKLALCFEPEEIKPPPRPRREVIFLTLEEIEAFISTIPLLTYKGEVHQAGLRLRTIVEALLGSAMRISELLSLNRDSINFERKEAKIVGKGIPLNKRVRTVLEFWAERFPNRKPNEFVLPFERYGGKGKDEIFGFAGSIAYDTDLSKPVGDWKEGWEAAKKRAGVTCRFHDLRHTGCTRMLEAGVPFSVVSDIMGWSPSTAVRMAKRYGHIGHSARREAVDKLAKVTVFDEEGAQKWAQNQDVVVPQVMQVLERIGSSGRTRTYNPPVNSRMLCH
jgi:integrase